MAHNAKRHCGANQSKHKEYRRRRYAELKLHKKVIRQKKQKRRKEYWESNLEYQKRQRVYYEKYASHNSYFQTKLDQHIKKYGAEVHT